MSRDSALRRWLREERRRENAEALAAGVEVGFGGDARAVAALRRMVVSASRADWARRAYPDAEIEIDDGRDGTPFRGPHPLDGPFPIKLRRW